MKVTPKNERGFTLLETAVALLLLAYSLTGLAALAKSSIQTNAQARYYSKAAHLAQQKMEDLRAGGYAALTSSVANEALTETGETTGNTMFTRNWSILLLVNPSNMKVMTVNVSWTDTLGTHQVQLRSMQTQ